MGCGSSSPHAAPHSVGVGGYPRQQYNNPSRSRQNDLYNDDDPTDDIPPEIVQVQAKKEQEPKPIPVTEKKDDPPQPEPLPVEAEKKKTAPTPVVIETEVEPATPPPEPTPQPKETEDKLIVVKPVTPPTSEDVNGIKVKSQGDVTCQDMSKLMMGRKTTVLDTRSGTSTPVPRPKVPAGELWVDDSFTLSIAFEGQKNLDWKRPGDIAPNPSLFVDGSNRFDIGQGSAGTCWFLSIVSALAEKEDIMKQVIPDDAYKIGTPEYDGIFHCKFWKFGEWIDIYIDDCLPIQSGTKRPWGSHSATNENEMWVPLLEKAFAKFQGSYLKAEGGWAGDAFIYLTGGMAERLEAKNFKAKVLFTRVSNALTSGSVIACSVPESKNGAKGLVGGHAYTLTGATVIRYKNNDNQLALFRIRNPWGSAKGEWTGDFSDKSPKWADVDDDTKQTMDLKSQGDGEFWMTLQDYCKYFTDTHLCNFTPDFDEDGKEDNLDKSSCIFGQWKGRTAAGKEIEDKMNNQKFVFTVPKKDLEQDGKMPLVLQFIQFREHRKSSDKFYIRADLFKIDEQYEKPKLSFVLDELTNNTTFWGGNSLCYRYRLEPGQYLILPTTMEPGKEKEFLIRLFASTNLDCKEIKETPSIFLRRFETTNTINGDIICTERLHHYPGLWKSRYNAGGQIKHRSFEKNPQFAFTISGKMDAYLMISLKQELLRQREAIGLKIYTAEKCVTQPLNLNYLWGNYKETMKTVTGEPTFIDSNECAGLFCLPPGNYVIIIFLENPDKERRYVLTLGTSKNSDIKLKEMNTVA